MQIYVHFLEPFDKYDTKIKAIVKGNSVKDLISFFIKKYGKDFKNTIFKRNKLDDSIMFLVNGVSIMGNLEQRLRKNDKVLISRTISGG